MIVAILVILARHLLRERGERARLVQPSSAASARRRRPPSDSVAGSGSDHSSTPSALGPVAGRDASPRRRQHDDLRLDALRRRPLSDPETVVSWGAVSDRARPTVMVRLVSAMFVHSGILHLREHAGRSRSASSGASLGVSPLLPFISGLGAVQSREPRRASITWARVRAIFGLWSVARMADCRWTFGRP